ncbi:MAG: SDR family NAD(P)-dependent oxidoreductase [Bacteroidales bacterium]|nr:SDR family NAD(P)-dependent oxidoreductase [Bacteroidales bacterium]
MNYYIITGTSRGIGEAIAKALLSKNNMLFCIARNESEALKNLAAEKGALIDQITFDLSNSAGIGTLMENIFQ